MTYIILGADGGVKITRVYEQRQAGEQRVLVDRLWPRGIAKTDERVGTWLPDVAPSADLRTWFHHDSSRFERFAEQYRAELESMDGSTQVEHLRNLASEPDCVLVTASRDVAHSHVPVLVDFLGGEPVPVVSDEHPIEMLERWEAFGGTWEVRERAQGHMQIDLMRCDGGEVVDSLSSADPKLLRWLDKRTLD